MKNSKFIIIIPIIVVTIALVFFVNKEKSSQKKTINLEKESELNYNIIKLVNILAIVIL